MTTYLQMDGVDDYLQIPSGFYFTDIEIELTWEDVGEVDFILRLITNTNSLIYNGSYLNGLGDFDYVKVNGTTISDSSEIPYGARLVLRASRAPIDNAVNIFADEKGQRTAKGNIYYIKFYNNSTLVTHYDMSTGTVDDQSGNGRHATLYGGTWVDDGTGSGTTTVVSSGDIFVSSTSELIGNGSALFNSQSILDSHSSIDANSNRIRNVLTDLGSISSINSTASKILDNTSNLSLSSSLIANGFKIVDVQSNLSSVSNLTVDGEIVSLDVFVNLSSTSSIGVDGGRIKGFQSNLSSISDLLSTGISISNGESELSSISDLIANGEIELEAAVNLSASSSIVMNGTKVIVGEGTLSSNGNIISTGTVLYDGESLFVTTSNLIAIPPDIKGYQQIFKIPLTIHRELDKELGIVRNKKVNLHI